MFKIGRQPNPVAPALYEPGLDGFIASESSLTPVELDMAQRIEHDRYVEDAPRLSDIASDATRTEPFWYSQNGAVEHMPEQQGLQELQAYLRTIDEPWAQDMLDNLTFVGRHEFARACQGIAAYWKHFLDSDPTGQSQLCVITLISHPRDGTIMKSDKFVREGVLAWFSNEDLARYGRRLVFTPAELTAPPERTRVVLLDDHTVTGKEMREDVYEKLYLDPAMQPYLERVEINTLSASHTEIAQGLKYTGDLYIPVKTFYRAHQSRLPIQTGLDTTDTTAKGAYTAVAHGRVDKDFADRIAPQPWLRSPDRPAIARVVSQYGSATPQYERALAARERRN